MEGNQMTSEQTKRINRAQKALNRLNASYCNNTNTCMSQKGCSNCEFEKAFTDLKAILEDYEKTVEAYESANLNPLEKVKVQMQNDANNALKEWQNNRRGSKEI